MLQNPPRPKYWQKEPFSLELGVKGRWGENKLRGVQKLRNRPLAVLPTPHWSPSPRWGSGTLFPTGVRLYSWKVREEGLPGLVEEVDTVLGETVC